MNSYVSYDIELLEDMQEGQSLKGLTPSVAAICTTVDDVEFFYDVPHMQKDTAEKLVKKMLDLYNQGYIPFGWNTLSFDYQLLAHYTGMYEECAKLALNGVDGMFMVVAHKGYYLGLDKVLSGAGLETKIHTVELNDRTTFSDMNGSKAPLLWRTGEHKAVIDYLWGDVVQPLKLIMDLETKNELRWTSTTGKPMLLRSKPMTVKECLTLPEPNVSWMKTPKYRHEYYDWIPEEILKKELS